MKQAPVSLLAVRRRAVVLPLMLLLFASSPAGAQGFQGVEPGQSFDIDLKSGVIQDPLPFDVHFYLTDTVDDAVASVEGRALGFKEARDCKSALASIQTCQPADKLCHPSQTATTKGDPGKRSFELLVTPLQPNRYYCFEFIILSDMTDPAERSLVQEAVDAAVTSVMSQNRWLDPANLQPTSGFAELRSNLLTAAQASLGRDKVLVPEPGTFFDTSIPVTQFDAPVGNQISSFLTAQVGLGDTRTNLQNRAADVGATGALKRLSASPLWQITVSALQANINQPLVEQLLAGRQDALGLIGLSQSEIVARSEGHTGTLDQIWDAEQIALAAVRQQLGDLQAIAAVLRTDEDLRNTAGLGEAALADQVAQACGSTLRGPVCGADPVTLVFFETLQRLADDAVAAFNDSLQASADNLKAFLAGRSEQLKQLTADLRALLIEVVNVRARTVADYETRATWYVGADLGTALAWDLEEAFTYAGANIYFRPVNKKAHLSWGDWHRGQRWTEFRKRFSVMLGLPQNQIDVENVEPLIQGRPALIGAGIRLSDFLRFTFAGALVFREKDPNPLVDDERLAWSPFVGLSIDWNIAGTFKTMFSSVFSTNPPPPPQGGK